MKSWSCSSCSASCFFPFLHLEWRLNIYFLALGLYSTVSKDWPTKILVCYTTDEISHKNCGKWTIIDQLGFFWNFSHQDFILELADTSQTLRTPRIPTKSDWIKLPFYQTYLFCLLQKLLIFAVYQKLADSVGHCFFRYRCWLLGLTCAELPAENLTLYCLPCPHLS